MPSPKIIHTIGFGSILTPSTRYRLLQFIPHLISSGYSVKFTEAKNVSNLFKFTLFLAKSRFYRATIFIQKKLFPISYIFLLSRSQKIIFDFDDSIWTSEKPRSSFTSWRVQTKLNYTLRKSSAVIVGNEFLANYAKKYNKNITIIPTVINPDEYPKKIHAYKKSITLGWIGQSVNFQYLSELHQQFLEIRRSIDFELLVISDKDFKMEGIEVTNERWSIKTELQSILKMDIGLMPLKENEWTNGKCSFKAIQYMASGIPTIASDVGSNKNLITNGVNGFLAKTPNDWADYIKALQSDHLLRIKIGKESIKTIEQKFSQKFAFQMLLKCIQTINDTPKK